MKIQYWSVEMLVAFINDCSYKIIIHENANGNLNSFNLKIVDHLNNNIIKKIKVDIE